MFAAYLDAAMRHAVYKQFEDGTYYGSIPGFRGVLANEPTREETRQELASVLEDWIVFRISQRLSVPEVDGHTLVYPVEHA